MVRSNTAIIAVAIIAGLIFVELQCLEAQSPMGAPVMSPGAPTAMAPATDCITALTNVSNCFSYVQVGSNMTVPDKACCPEFAGLLESNLICLCQLVGNAEGFGVDISRALMLPDACKVEFSPLNSCPASPSPSPSPDGGTALTPTASRNGGSNGASSSAVHDLSTLICLAVAIFIAYYF